MSARVDASELSALDRGGEWLNTQPLGAGDLRGKVVLVQFWTYTCINWLRTLPHIRDWSHRYHGGVVVIGVHTPEFPFEHDAENVRHAVTRLRVDYPTVLDNAYAVWRAFDNHYWPALYVFDSRGRVRHHFFGEGGYEESDRVTQGLLVEAGDKTSYDEPVVVEPDGLEREADWRDLRSAETYLRPDDSSDGRSWSLTGKWRVGNQAVVSTASGASILNRFHARDLHLVMAPAVRGTTVRFRVTVDGRPPESARGLDVDDAGNGAVVEPRLYQLIRQPKPIVDRRFRIEFLDADVEAYSFTFG